MAHPARAVLHLEDAAEVGPAFLRLPEDQWFDRKSARSKATQLAEDICGFANAEGGLIVLGLHDGRVEGVTSNGDENAWRQANVDFVEPPASVEVSRLACRTSSGREDHVVFIDVAASERLHRTP